MVTTEIKFLFQGIIFTAAAHVLQQDGEQKEIMIRFSTKYLINRFRNFYKFKLRGNRFAAIFDTSDIEANLIQEIQKAILQHPELHFFNKEVYTLATSN